MPDDTQLTPPTPEAKVVDNPQDVIDEVLGGDEQKGDKDIVHREIEEDKVKEAMPVVEEVEKVETPEKVPTELLTPPPSMPTPPPMPEPEKPEPEKLPPLSPPSELPPTTPNKQDVPLAFAGTPAPVTAPTSAPTPPIKPLVGSPPPAMPPGLTPKKMVEPKKSNKKKVMGIVAGVALLLAAVVGGLSGYKYLQEPVIIMSNYADRLIRQREKSGGCVGAACMAPEVKEIARKASSGDSASQAYLDSLKDDRAGSTGSNTLAILEMTEIANGDKDVGDLGDGRGEFDVTSGVDDAVRYCNEHGGSNCDTATGMGSFLQNANVNLYNEYQRILASNGSAGLTDLSDEDKGIASLCGENHGKVVGIDSWPAGFSVDDGRVTAIDCRLNVSGKYVGKAYYDSSARSVSDLYSNGNNVNGCAGLTGLTGLTRTSDGESHRGGFVGCNGSQNCFCSGGVEVGGQYTSGKLECFDDYAGDSCAYERTGTYTAPSSPPDSPPDTPPNTPATLMCSSIAKDVVSPKIGDKVVFTCAGAVTPTDATALTYEFRYRRNAGEWFDLTATGTKTEFTIALAGDYDVQCKTCGTIDNASVCDPTWVGASQ